MTILVHDFKKYRRGIKTPSAETQRTYLVITPGPGGPVMTEGGETTDGGGTITGGAGMNGGDP